MDRALCRSSPGLLGARINCEYELDLRDGERYLLVIETELTLRTVVAHRRCADFQRLTAGVTLHRIAARFSAASLV